MGYLSKYGPWILALKGDDQWGNIKNGVARGDLAGVGNAIMGVSGGTIGKGVFYSILWSKAKSASNFQDPI